MDAQRKAEKGHPGAWYAGHLLLVLLAGASWLGLSALNVWMGELNQDEGWYLNAAKLMTEGQVPYRDFAFTQPPLLPVVYAAVYHWGRDYGLLGGRVLTWFLGTLGTLAAVGLAMRAGPRRAPRFTAWLCLLPVAINVYQSYFTTIVKTYALAGLFLASGLALLSFVGPKKGFRAALGAGFLLACAAATRITLGAALALGGLYLLVFRQRLKKWAWLDFAIGGGLGLGLTLLPFMALGREGFRFGLVEYHALRESGPWLAQLAYKVGCLSRLAQAYFPALIGGLFLLIVAVRYLLLRDRAADSLDPDAGAVPEPGDIGPRFNCFLWITVGVLGLVHLAAPFPYDDYQVPVYPVFCAALAATGARWWLREEGRRFGGEAVPRHGSRRQAVLIVTWLVCSLHAFASPLAQSWFVAGRDRIWWRLREQSPVAQLRDMARWVYDLNLAAQGTELLTQDTYLAFEARMPVPHGLEMGPFSYYPEWPRERAEQIGVLNRDMLLELLANQTNAPIAAFSGYGLAIRCPEVAEVDREDRLAFDEILAARYEPVESVPGFGQAGTTLELWRLKPEIPVWTPPPAQEEE